MNGNSKWFQVDFSQFQTSNWKNLVTKSERLTLLQKLEDTMANEQGRDGRKVKTDESVVGMACGYYDSNQPQYLYINECYIAEYSNNYCAMDTVIHEGRHAYQYDAINTYLLNGTIQGSKLGNAPKAPTNRDIELWIKNSMISNKPPYRKNHRKQAYYMFQPCEDDAHGYAYERMQQLELKYNYHDENYTEYEKSDYIAWNEMAPITLAFVQKNPKQYIVADIERRYSTFISKYIEFFKKTK